MTRKLLVRQGGGTASEVDFLDFATPRKGSPWFDRDTPLFQMGQRFANGEAAMGYFKIVDPAAALSTTGFRTRPWAEVRLTEDASGNELTLAWMRITANDASRRAPYTGGDQVEHDPQLMDCNMDLRGLPFQSGWHRDAENEGERLNALEGVKLNGASSTGDIFRVTTDVTIAAIADGHLCDMSDSFDLDTVNYPAGTEPAEIIADIAEQSGKIFGVVLHHTGGTTHKCLLYVDQDDLTTYTTDVRISDQLADHDPDDDDAPTFEPHWLMGAGREQNMEGVISGLVSIYGGIDGEERTVFVETGDDDDEWETWVGVFNDDQADTLTVAERHANWQLTDRKRPYQTHKVSILVRADQAHLVEAGMAIETKSVVMEPGPNKHAWIWRRVAEKTIEPAPDGRYWLHLHLERPRHTHGANGGGGQPRSTNPKPAPQPVPDVPGTVIVEWDFEDGNSNDTTNTYNSGLTYQAAGTGNAPDGSAHGWTTASHRATAAIPVASDTDYVFSLDCQWFFDVAIRNIYVKWNGAGGSESGLADDQYIIKGAGHAQDTTYHASKTIRSPVGATTVSIWWSPYSGIKTDNIIISTAGTVTEDDPDALPDGGDSPYYARSDDPRFTNDDQHITTKLQQRVLNNSGVTLEAGDVVVPDTTIDGPAVTRTTTASSTAGPIGVVIEGGADDSTILVMWSGAATFVNTNGTPADGDYLFTSTTAGAADRSGTRATGAFGRIVRDDGAGETLYVLLWGVPDSGGGGGAVATDAIWDAKGDLAAGTGANTAAKLTVGTNDTVLMADSGQSTGLKWVPSQTPSNQAYGDSAAEGTADTYARGDHKHGFPAASNTIVVQENDSTVDAAATTLDFGTGLDVTSSPAGEANIVVDASEIPLDTLGAPTDITTLNASTSAHGLLKKLPNDATKYLDGTGNYTDPGLAGGSTGNVIATPSGSAITIPGLGLADRKPASPGTYDEEWDGTADTLPANWSWSGGAPSGSDEWKLNSRWPSLLTVEGTGNANYNLARSSFSPGSGAFGLWCKAHIGPFAAADKVTFRMYIYNAGLTEGRGANFRASGSHAGGVRHLKTISSAESVWYTEHALGKFINTLYLGITRDGSNNWTAWVSQDGLGWDRQDNAAQAHSFTVATILLGFGTANGSQSFIAVDWIRYRTDQLFPRP